MRARRPALLPAATIETMRERTNGMRWAMQFAAAFVAWTFLSLLYAMQQQRLALLIEDRVVPLWNPLWPALKTYWICALLTPAAIEWAQRVELCGRRWWRFAAAHLAGLLLF